MAEPTESHDSTQSSRSTTATATALPTKTLKRDRESSVEITNVQPAKKHCRLNIGSISIPKNDATLFSTEERHGLFHTFCPLDRTNITKALAERFLHRVTYGLHGNHVVEKLVLDADDEMGIPWQVPKVTVEYKRIDYLPCTRCSGGCDGEPVSATTMPTVEQMSAAEYGEAVERGDPAVAPFGRCTFDFCRDLEVGWLEYKDR